VAKYHVSLIHLLKDEAGTKSKGETLYLPTSSFFIHITSMPHF